MLWNLDIAAFLLIMLVDFRLDLIQLQIQCFFSLYNTDLNQPKVGMALNIATLK